MEQNDTNTDKRSFVGPDNETTYYIVPPDSESIRGADWHYSKTYTKSLVEGITTLAEMRDILTQRGIIGPEFEQRAQELSEDLAIKLDVLENAEDLDTKRDSAVDVALARDELYQWNQRLNGPLSNTCENISDEARLEYLTSSMVEDCTGNKLWDSYDSFLKDKNQDLATKSKFETMLYLQGLESSFLDNTPEAVAMQEVETEVIEKAQKALDAINATTDEEKAVKKSKSTNSAKVKTKHPSKSKIKSATKKVIKNKTVAKSKK